MRSFSNDSISQYGNASGMVSSGLEGKTSIKTFSFSIAPCYQSIYLTFVQKCSSDVLLTWVVISMLGPVTIHI